MIVGRPNVGKSTLFNRLPGTRRAMVTEKPGITRDGIYGKAEWREWELEIVDTGGIVPRDKELIPREILRQARVPSWRSWNILQAHLPHAIAQQSP